MKTPMMPPFYKMGKKPIYVKEKSEGRRVKKRNECAEKGRCWRSK